MVDRDLIVSVVSPIVRYGVDSPDTRSVVIVHAPDMFGDVESPVVRYTLGLPTDRYDASVPDRRDPIEVHSPVIDRS